MKKAIIGIAMVMGLVSAKSASAQMVFQIAYSSASEANITVSSSVATQLDSSTRIKNDRRLVLIQNIGTNDVWCALNSAPAVSTGFFVAQATVAASSTYTYPNMLNLPITSNVPVYCKAAAGAAGTVRFVQMR